MLDVDMVLDMSEVYPDGWAGLVAELGQTLAQQQKHLSRVTAGASHTVALTDAGDLYTWGWGDSGQLGHGRCGTVWCMRGQSRPVFVQPRLFMPVVTESVSLIHCRYL